MHELSGSHTLVCKADLHAIHHAVICNNSKVSSAVSLVEKVMVCTL